MTESEIISQKEAVAMLDKNDIIELNIDALSSDGSGIGRHDGMAIFVPDTAIGDKLLVRILKVNKTYAYAKIEKLLEASKDRVEPDCNVRTCGGCVYRHISYEAELCAKEQSVRDAFKRVGGFDLELEPIVGSLEINRYRNKVQLPVSTTDGKAFCGFFSPRSHRVVPVYDCLLQPEIFTEICGVIIDYINQNKISVYDEKTGRGLLRHIYLRRGFHTGEIMLSLVCTKETKLFDRLVEVLSKCFPKIKTVLLNINSANTNVILGNRDICLYGSGTIRDTMCGVTVEISPHSFYQVNTEAAENVYNTAKEFLNLDGSETLLDLYCGIGTVGLSMAQSVKRLIGVEIVPAAIKNAERNAEINGITNAEFFTGDAGTVAKKLSREGVKPDVVIVDPPRRGCDTETLNAIAEMSPKKLVYISCNPATCARDLNILAKSGYELVRYKPFDMFPRTAHVECVSLMSRANE
ncbi:MAG: 23S rRNA (uracil(1939)-C(5))-methyltransferase RlmD [Oscillospiraceae bacterium]|nr:23S rRNA (uracil(1939)-C(5))-methyltransferase RlmD [Oscillospiraceae bacterium]